MTMGKKLDQVITVVLSFATPSFQGFVRSLVGFLRWHGVLAKSSTAPRSLALTRRQQNWSQATFSQHGEDLVLERIFFNFLGYSPAESFVYVDCGAYHPFQYSMTARLALLGWHGVAIDFSKTTKRSFARHRKSADFVLAAVGDGSTLQIDIGRNRRVGDASLTSSTWTPVEGTNSDATVQSLRISDILDSHSINRVDFLNLDVEGAELSALQGIDFSRHAPSVICVEIHGVVDLTAISSEPVARFLLETGYILFSATVINFFFLHRESIPSDKRPQVPGRTFSAVVAGQDSGPRDETSLGSLSE